MLLSSAPVLHDTDVHIKIAICSGNIKYLYSLYFSYCQLCIVICVDDIGRRQPLPRGVVYLRGFHWPPEEDSDLPSKVVRQQCTSTSKSATSQCDDYTYNTL